MRAGARIILAQQYLAGSDRCAFGDDNLDDGFGELEPLHFREDHRLPELPEVETVRQGLATLITGDAIPTIEHLEAGRVLQDAADVDRARESFAEAIEIADMFVLGRDNVAINPMRRPF